ncbi:transcription factor HES-5-like [Trichomycterus rosablanca]|uniref:transcription factor HES-5-like n=1 Tax=Trichomycterus rosablanca TaxID=2290929 RepID=UPI002F351CFB
MQSQQTRFTLHRDLQHRDPTMVPAITSSMNLSHQHQPLKKKLRKPMVEKMRRDRINSSIDQLKSLLAPQFLNQQPDSRMEKGDILEMTVSFMKQHQQQSALSTSSAAVHQGFSRCVHELVHFLSKEEVNKQNTESHRKLLQHFQNLNKRESAVVQLSSEDQQIFSKEESLSKNALWRPW